MNIAHKALNLANRIRDRRFYRTYRRFQSYTMVQPHRYVTNLKLALASASVPGAIVECGTWRGGMIAGLAETLGKDREYVLYDSFEGLPEVEAIDGIAAKKWQEATDSNRFHDNCTANESDAATAMSMANATKARLVKGWFEDTLPQEKFPNGIAILRMDADWYKSTYQILSALFPHVNENGLILIDDYYTWDGCSKAVHDYLSEHKRPERIASLQGVCYMKIREAQAQQ